MIESLQETSGGFRRGVIELAGLDAAEVAGVTDAVADVDRRVFPGEVTHLSH